MPSAQSVSAVTAAATFVTGGSSGDIQIAGQISGSVVESNFLLHPKPTWEQEVRRQQQLEQAGEKALEYAKENPEVIVDGATLLLLPELAGSTLALRKIANQAGKTVATSVVKSTTKQAVKRETPTRVINKIEQNVVKEVKQSKPKGINNVNIRAAQQRGMKAHREFKNKIRAKKDKGWLDNPKIYDKDKNKYLIPDAISPSGRPVELKPRTTSGIKKGREQIKEYEKVLNKKGKVVYYDPN